MLQQQQYRTSGVVKRSSSGVPTIASSDENRAGRHHCAPRDSEPPRSTQQNLQNGLRRAHAGAPFELAHTFRHAVVAL